MKHFAHHCRLFDTILTLIAGATLIFLASWLLRM